MLFVVAKFGEMWGCVICLKIQLGIWIFEQVMSGIDRVNQNEQQPGVATLKEEEGGGHKAVCVCVCV